MIYIAKTHPNATLPVQGTKVSAGLDLAAAWSGVVEPNQQKLIGTGISMAIPMGYAGFIWPRSKLAFHYSLHVMAGVIDADYRGEIQVLLRNFGNSKFVFEEGDRIAQLVIQPLIFPLLIEEVASLDETARQNQGITCSDLRLK